MTSIDREITEHSIPLYPDVKPVKHKLCQMKSEFALKIKKDIQKQFDVIFLRYLTILNRLPTLLEWLRKIDKSVCAWTFDI